MEGEEPPVRCPACGVSAAAARYVDAFSEEAKDYDDLAMAQCENEGCHYYGETFCVCLGRPPPGPAGKGETWAPCGLVHITKGRAPDGHSALIEDRYDSPRPFSGTCAGCGGRYDDFPWEGRSTRTAAGYCGDGECGGRTQSPPSPAPGGARPTPPSLEGGPRRSSSPATARSSTALATSVGAATATWKTSPRPPPADPLRGANPAPHGAAGTNKGALRRSFLRQE